MLHLSSLASLRLLGCKASDADFDTAVNDHAVHVGQLPEMHAVLADVIAICQA